MEHLEKEELEKTAEAHLVEVKKEYSTFFNYRLSNTSGEVFTFRQSVKIHTCFFYFLLKTSLSSWLIFETYK